MGKKSKASKVLVEQKPSKYQLWMQETVEYFGIFVTRETAFELCIYEHGDWNATKYVTELPDEDVHVTEEEAELLNEDGGFDEPYIMCGQCAFECFMNGEFPGEGPDGNPYVTGPGQDADWGDSVEEETAEGDA